MLTDLYVRIRQALACALTDEEGQGLVEYGLIVTFIAIVMIVLLAVIGHQVTNSYSNVSSGLGT
ncbi:MAG: Flp family type IVb pilin [Candidatus Dormibacter sp.]